MAPSAARTRRGHERRERILESAAELVAVRGFHAVGVTEIGAAAGVTGAALYRHFSNKSEILVALLDRVVEQLLIGARQVLSAGYDPATALRALIALHLDFAVEQRSILAVYAQESHHLAPDDQRRLRAKQRRYVDLWSKAYRQVHPRTAEARARVRVEAVFGLINSVPNVSADIDHRMLRSELRQLAEAALL
jgi:AcrR family transcriptional regulator